MTKKCDEDHPGECVRMFWERLKDHLRATSPILDHANMPGHPTCMDNFSIVGRESLNFTRTIKKAMFRRVNDPSFNRKIGKYQLSHMG